MAGAGLDEVEVFSKVVRTGSLTAAARELRVQKSSVSRRLAALEARLGTRLIQRTTRTLHLTEEGRVYYEHCVRALAELEEAENLLNGRRSSPKGLIRVTAPLSFGLIGAGIARFLDKNSEVQLELSCTDRVVDLVEEGFDVAIRAGPLTPSALIARRLGGFPLLLVASPNYLAREGLPKRPADLSKHRCLAFGARLQTQWKLIGSEGAAVDPAEVKISAPLAINDYDLLRQVVLSGGGIGLIPELDCRQELKTRALKHVLPQWRSAEVPIHAVYPSTRQLSSKVRAFIDSMQAELRPGQG